MNQILMWIVSAGVILGGIDLLLGNRWGYGKQFEKGFELLGPTALSMAGILCLSGLLSGGLSPGARAFFEKIGLDPSMFGGLIAIDMGGFHLAKALALDPVIGLYAGLIPAATLGCSLVFTIPVGSKLMEEKDMPYLCNGMAIGMLTLPAALIVGGLLFGLGFVTTLKQNIFLFIFALICGLGLFKYPGPMLKVFQVFTRILKIILTVGLMIGAVKMLTGAEFLPGLMPLPEAMQIVVSVCVFMLGSLPITLLLQRILKKPLSAAGKALGMNEVSMAALLIGFVTAMPVFALAKEMDPKGRLVNLSFLFCSTAVFGAHLGFTAEVAPDYLGAVIVSKLIGALLAGVCAILLSKRLISE
ncbi:MAG: ethanolamine utilization protein EutH [Firmicutes bacterium]|nr:ethanolamine utilization protein EutH [Bacillota bacterium]